VKRGCGCKLIKSLRLTDMEVKTKEETKLGLTDMEGIL
jgi:MinD superfamily P-loop ATPase